MRYAFNCFLLVVPPLLFNAVFAGRLPASYQAARWDQVPAAVVVPEDVLRLATMLLPLLLPISLAGLAQRIGAMLYVGGMAAYVAVWSMQIHYPHAAWSLSAAGFLAPAYTPALWLAGIALIGIRPTIPHLRYLPLIFVGVGAAFLIVHNLHAILVYQQGGTS